ncbi:MULTISPECIES: fibrobacter succinogenes major paralogous domain-containing protein [Sanguibacteroides]|nr:MULTISPECIES: fibrobacter succinogenes major paralogous domain-containing protein [Sanguibacteroides]PXZ43352.1 hypothetical protein DMB45_11185 [Sanguibacteroides justesenii]
MMRIKTFMISIVFLTLLFACEKDEKELTVKPKAEGVFVDNRTGIEYSWVRIGNLDWMVQNLSGTFDDIELGSVEPYYNTDESDDKQLEDIMGNMEKYGFLYTYEKALAAAPEGWRVATDEDWQQLEKALGMKDNELDQLGFRGSIQGELMQQGADGTGLHMQLGGYYGWFSESRGKCDYLGVYGFFWAASADENSEKAVYRKIVYNSPQVYRGTTLKIKRMSVRCVRDAQDK